MAKSRARHWGAAAIRRVHSSLKRPPQARELANPALFLDVPVSKVLIGAARTPAFGAAMMFGLILTWLGAVVPAPLSPVGPPRPEQAATHRDPAPAAPVLGDTGRGSEAPATSGEGVAFGTEVDPKVFTALETLVAELNRQAPGSEEWISHLPSTAPSCETPCDQLSPSEPVPGLDQLPHLSEEVGASVPSTSEEVGGPVPSTMQTPDEQSRGAPLPNAAPPDSPASSSTEPPADQSRGPLPGPAVP